MTRRFLFAALLWSLFVPGQAAAQGSDRQVLLDRSSWFASWTGAKATGSTPLTLPSGAACQVSAAFTCDRTLLTVSTDPTNLLVGVVSQPGQDFDLHVFESDAQGLPLAPAGSSSGSAEENESVLVPDAAGYYLAVIHYKDVADAAPEAYAAVPTFAPPPTDQQPQPQPPPAPPSFAFRAFFGKAKLSAARTKGFPIAFDCSAACTGTAQVSIDAKTAKKYKLGKKATVVGKAAFDKPAGTHGLNVKLSAKAKKALKKAKALKLTLSASATSGSTTQTSSAKATFK
jgi:hypothetical protein